MGHLRRLCPQRKTECMRCSQNLFKLHPACEKHESGRQEIVLMFDDRETLDALNVLVWDLERVAEAIIAQRDFQEHIIEALVAKLPKKKRLASERNRRSVVYQSLIIPKKSNKIAVDLIETRDRLSRITQQWIEKQKEQRKRVKWKKPNKSKSRQPIKKGSIFDEF